MVKSNKANGLLKYKLMAVDVNSLSMGCFPFGNLVGV
jgi:hypothetical protein